MSDYEVTKGASPICSMPGCDKPHRARGLCNTHYHYLRRHNHLPPKLYPETCTIDGCDKNLEARGLCYLHYTRWRKRGTVELNRPTATDRFWAKAKVGSPEECWLWQGSHNTFGHGTFWSGSTPIGAHRYSYELATGPIPAGLTIDHLCKVPACINPRHLEAVTHRENNLRSSGVSALNAVKTHCLRGHPFDAQNTYSYKGKRYCRACMKVRDKLRLQQP